MRTACLSVSLFVCLFGSVHNADLVILIGMYTINSNKKYNIGFHCRCIYMGVFYNEFSFFMHLQNFVLAFYLKIMKYIYIIWKAIRNPHVAIYTCIFHCFNPMQSWSLHDCNHDHPMFGSYSITYGNVLKMQMAKKYI